MRRKHLIFSIAFLLLCSFVALIAVSQQKTLLQLEVEMNNAKDRLYNPDNGAYPEYKEAFDTLEGKIKKVISDHGNLKGIKLSPKLEWGSALVDGIDKNMTAKYLSDSIRQQLVDIETWGNHVEFLWLDVQAAWYAYYNAVGAYNYKLRHDYNMGDDGLVGIQEPSKETPTPLYFCSGSCDQLFETASAAQVSHQVYCPEKHGSSGTTGVTFYACSGSCGRSAEHWLVCGGTCGNKYAPKRINRGQGNYSYVANSPHYVKCEKSVYDFWNPNATCGEEYYTCQYSTCPESSTHWSSGSSNPQPTDNTPNCSDCTSDCSSPCGCSISGTCGGTVSSPPADPPPSGSGSGKLCSNCPDTYDPSNAFERAHHEDPQTCTKCHATYYLCQNKLGACSVAETDEELNYGAYHTSE